MRVVVLLFLAFIGAAAAQAAEPGFVLRAENRYREALRAFVAARANLVRVREREAQASRSAMASSGQWFEPPALWRKKLAAVSALNSARKKKREASKELDRARDAARRLRVGTPPRPEPLSSPFWWLW